MSNNPPYRTVELTQEQYEFLLNNCEANMTVGLRSLQILEDRSSQEKVVKMIEDFKGIRDLLQRSR